MRKAYTKPALEVEEYQLNKAIATNCDPIITLGPGAPNHDVCPEFDGAFEISLEEAPSMNSSGNVPFYNDGSAGCDCYYTSGGNSYFSS